MPKWRHRPFNESTSIADLKGKSRFRHRQWEKKLRQKNALFTMISVRELRDLIDENEGRPIAPKTKPKIAESKPRKKKKSQRWECEMPCLAECLKETASRSPLLTPLVFPFHTLTIGRFSVLAPELEAEDCNVLRIDESFNAFSYDFCCTSGDEVYRCVIAVPVHKIERIFAATDEVKLKLKELDGITISVWLDTVESTVDVTAGQLAQSSLHTLCLRVPTSAFQQQLLARNSALFSPLFQDRNREMTSELLVQSHYLMPCLEGSEWARSFSLHGLGSLAPPQLLPSPFPSPSLLPSGGALPYSDESHYFMECSTYSHHIA